MKTGRSKAFYLREMIEEGISEMEAYYMATDVLDRVRAGKEKVYTSAEVRSELGLDD
jgi:RHH-type rel operon transcriptional repressor/antitoxin RelB